MSTTTSYIALLRGVNVGGRNIKMAELKACFEALGLSDVRTVLASGNVLFESNATSQELKTLAQDALGDRFDYPARVHVLARDTLRAILEASPYEPDPTFHAYVLFLEDGLEQQLAEEAVPLAPGEALTTGAGVLYWRCPKGSTLDSAFAKLLTKRPYKDAHTNRNINTLRKLL